MKNVWRYSKALAQAAAFTALLQTTAFGNACDGLNDMEGKTRAEGVLREFARAVRSMFAGATGHYEETPEYLPDGSFGDRMTRIWVGGRRADVFHPEYVAQFKKLIEFGREQYSVVFKHDVDALINEREIDLGFPVAVESYVYELRRALPRDAQTKNPRTDQVVGKMLDLHLKFFKYGEYNDPLQQKSDAEFREGIREYAP
ncbi:hypothetical protein E3A20_06550 [Planctomyces bekefii]|uniref:Uncharacterized protein n=1 Tax=Planctomyces bekefii TaxID=1653850 RepID=A0A5C6M8V4_9PLAN|nr:hypothetical protein E3A20_06550 [Planctomyces bekefii]